MFKKAHYIAFATVLAVTLIVLNLPARTAAQFKLAISGLFLPLFGLTNSAERLLEKTGDAVVPRSELLRQLEQIRLENQHLQMETMRLEEAAHENQRLRRMLQLQAPSSWRLKLGRVVARDPVNWWRSVKIDLGLRDGVSTNSPVLTPQGLVGRVSELGYTQSRVVLVGDPDCRVAVVLEGDSRDNGVIAPTSTTPLDTSIVDLGFLGRNRQIKPGQQVFTSGLGGIFPKGVLVGSIADVRSVEYGLYSEARVKLAVNMNELEEVWVLLP